MNYQHNYHAGNFADVVKHLILIDILLQLHEKSAPFCVIDSHSGQGLYDLQINAALKTGEAHKGILSLQQHDCNHPILLQYFDIIATHNQRFDTIRFYPGSPCIVQALLRAHDHLYVNELHPNSYETLRYLLKSEKRITISNLDGYLLLKSLLPPVQKRGIFLIDPPFEHTNEVQQIVKSLKQAVRCFVQGIYIIWYPIKQHTIANDLMHQVRNFYNKKILNVQFFINNVVEGSPLSAAGLLILNPPGQSDFRVTELLKTIMARLNTLQPCRYSVTSIN